MMLVKEIRSTDKARRFSLLHSRRQLRIERYFFPKIFSLLKKQITDFISALDNGGYHYALYNINSIIGFGDIAKLIKELYHKSAYIESNYVLMGFQSSRKSLKRIDQQPVLGLTLEELTPVIDGYFRIRLLNDSAIPITDYTKDMITGFLSAQVESGASFEEAVKNFKQIAITWTGRGGRAERRARNIVITESTRAMSFGGMIGAYMSGVDCDKIWVTSNDERVRGYRDKSPFPHTRLDLNRSSIFGTFYNGENIKFPGDPDASIANVAGCRCAMFFEEKLKPKPIAVRLLSNFLVEFFSSLVVNRFFTKEIV